jgi:hypothetical protein
MLVCQHLFSVAAGGNATCFAPFLGSSSGIQEYWHYFLNYIIDQYELILCLYELLHKQIHFNLNVVHFS